MTSKANKEAYETGHGDFGFNTIALRSGHKVDSDNRARAPPIFQSTSFEFKSAEHGKQLFALAEVRFKLIDETLVEFKNFA